jgi:hypothetical protein
MSLQNRVTPFGEIIAAPERGLFTGNRGIIHDPATWTLLSRRWVTKTWLVCSCDFKGTRRDVMGGRSWMELFFLDEATAFAAGHRPCFLCRRDAAERFRAAWSVGNRTNAPAAAAMDTALHHERLQGRQKRLHILTAPAEDLPDGAMIAVGGSAWLVAGSRPFRWSPAGYEPSAWPALVDGLLTPPSALAALLAGYRPVLHSSCAEATAPEVPQREKDFDDVRPVRQ